MFFDLIICRRRIEHILIHLFLVIRDRSTMRFGIQVFIYYLVLFLFSVVKPNTLVVWYLALLRNFKYLPLRLASRILWIWIIKSHHLLIWKWRLAVVIFEVGVILCEIWLSYPLWVDVLVLSFAKITVIWSWSLHLLLSLWPVLEVWQMLWRSLAIWYHLSKIVLLGTCVITYPVWITADLVSSWQHLLWFGKGVS